MRLAILVIASLLSAALDAKTPDGEPPAVESICDPLREGHTSGLYGLCVAYCEAQDCEPDLARDDPLTACRAGSKSVLKNYNRKRQAGDPAMPCIQDAACPCWTADHLGGLRYQSDIDSSATCLSDDGVAIWQISHEERYNTLIGATDQRCALTDVCASGDCMNVTTPAMLLTEAQAAACMADVRATAAARFAQCGNVD